MKKSITSICTSSHIVFYLFIKQNMKLFNYWALVLLGLSSLFLLGCDSPNKVHLGDTVSVQYTSTFTDGTTFETSWATFVVGSGQVIAGLENGVMGMKVGQMKKVTVTPDQWYGSHYSKLQLQKISKLLFDKMTDNTGDTSNIRVIGWVRWVLKGVEKDQAGNEMVLRDINPRETRENLVYKITLVSKE